MGRLQICRELVFDEVEKLFDFKLKNTHPGKNWIPLDQAGWVQLSKLHGEGPGVLSGETMDERNQHGRHGKNLGLGFYLASSGIHVGAGAAAQQEDAAAAARAEAVLLNLQKTCLALLATSRYKQNEMQKGNYDNAKQCLLSLDGVGIARLALGGSLLESAFAARAGENYGLSKKALHFPLVKPYRAADLPKERAMFLEIWETLAKTAIYYVATPWVQRHTELLLESLRSCVADLTYAKEETKALVSSFFRILLVI